MTMPQPAEVSVYAALAGEIAAAPATLTLPSELRGDRGVPAQKRGTMTFNDQEA